MKWTLGITWLAIIPGCFACWFTLLILLYRFF